MAGYSLLFVFPSAMAYAAASDLLTMRIANSVSLGLVAAFLVIALIAGMPAQEMLLHLAIGAALLVAGMLLFSLNLVGGGDAKLLAAAGLWIGYDQLVPFLLYVTIFGGALALLLLAYRRFPATALPLPTWAVTPARRRGRHAVRHRHRRRSARRLPADQAGRRYWRLAHWQQGGAPRVNLLRRLTMR